MADSERSYLFRDYRDDYKNRRQDTRRGGLAWVPLLVIPLLLIGGIALALPQDQNSNNVTRVASTENAREETASPTQTSNTGPRAASSTNTTNTTAQTNNTTNNTSRPQMGIGGSADTGNGTTNATNTTRNTTTNTTTNSTVPNSAPSTGRGK